MPVPSNVGQVDLCVRKISVSRSRFRKLPFGTYPYSSCKTTPTLASRKCATCTHTTICRKPLALDANGRLSSCRPLNFPLSSLKSSSRLIIFTLIFSSTAEYSRLHGTPSRACLSKLLCARLASNALVSDLEAPLLCALASASSAGQL